MQKGRQEAEKIMFRHKTTLNLQKCIGYEPIGSIVRVVYSNGKKEIYAQGQDEIEAHKNLCEKLLNKKWYERIGNK